jgi:uncharacterized membrane protein
MEKIVIFAVLFILTVVLVYIVGSGITGMFIGFGQPTNAEWWNTSWHYRIRIDIDTDQYGRTNWPVEQQINFTDMLPSGTFDVNSTRIVEYSQSGSVLYEVPSQFDIGDNFDVSDNALGNLVFLLNGTTPSSTNRTFYVYYDTLENGAKEFKTYPTNLTFDQSGSIVTANSTNLRLFIDTNRGENTSGIHRAEDPYGNVIIAAGQGSRTAEYNEYSNGTSNTTFDLINNASFVNGSVRTIIEQIGNEIVFGQPSQQTNEMTVKKRYYIYNIVGPEQFGSFIKIEQTVTNSAGYQIQRNSTPAGSSTFDLGRTLNSGSIDTQDVENQNPYSWAWGSGVGGEMVGILNLEQNWTTNYFAANVPFDRIGIQLNSTDIGAGSSLRQVSLVYFSGTGGTDATTEFLDIKNRFEDPIVIYQSLPERWYVTATTSMNETIYNRNETVLIRGNVSQGDPYNLTEYMNATLDMGTPSPADDQTIILYDDGLHGDFGADDEIFANTFEIANDAAINEWTVNFTTYSNYSDFLNWTVHNFNVTDVLNVTVNIIDNKPQIGETVFADIYVKNYMQTKDITGAVINCSYDLTDVVNKTDNGDGTYSVNFTSPLTEGTYILYCNATKDGNFGNHSQSFDAEAAKTNVSIVAVPDNTTVSNITLYDNESFTIEANATNIQNGTAYQSNISLDVISGWYVDNISQECSDIEKNSFCNKNFSVTVPNGTVPGNYYLNLTVEWRNPDDTVDSNTTSINVTVEPNPSINVSESVLADEAGDGSPSYIGNFTVLSIGNSPLQNITFDCYSGTVCNDFVVNFTPNDIPNLDMNGNYSVAVNVTVPLGYPVGNYTGTVNVSAENDDYRNLTLNITVPSNRTWTMDPTKCDKSETDEEGTVCLVTVMNLGNDVINFTVSPQELNHIKVNATSFYVNNWSNYTINVTYNITGFQQAVYNTIFDVDANQSNSNPDNMTLNATLYPYLPPIINFTITPNLTEQNSSVTVFANVTDASNSGIEWVNISVTKPDGSSNQTTMNLMSTAGNFSQWNFTYPDGLGNTSLRGAYNVTVTAVDNIGNIGNLSKNFTVHVKLVVSSTTLSTTYLQGDTGSIFYTAKDVNGTGIENVNVTFTIWDATGNISHYTLQQTSFDGIIFPLPTFSLASDAVTGNYTLFSNSTYYDSIANATVNTEKNSTFIVDPRTVTVTGLFADVETAVAWYPDNEMKFGILVYNGEGRPVDPDNMTITVYRPDDLVYGLFPFNMSSMTRMSTGYYTFAYQMDYGTPPGMYLAVLNVTQDDFTTSKITAFRVSQGGPYDVRINLFENEIPQGDYLDFELVVENKGSVTQDVYVEYNVTEMDLKNYFYDGETLYNYYYWAEAVLTPAFSNQSFTRQAHILSNQPLGTYLLSAKLTYDYVQPPIRPNATFSVVAAKVIPPAPPQPPTGQELVYVKEPEKAVGASIMIVGYNNNISLARGITKIENVVVRNSGSTNLNNVSLFVLGIPTDWFKITPERYATLVPDNSSVFLIEFNIPDNANIGEYKINFLALSGVVSDQKSSTVNIYSSIKELLEDEIKKIEEDLIDLKVDVRLAEREGKDVSDVMKFIDSIENYIKDAKNQIENNEFDRAIESVSSAINLLKKARDTLDNLEALQPEGFITIWIILILLIVIIAVVFLVVYLWRKKKLKPLLRPYVIQISRLMERAKRKEVDLEKLQKDKEKVLRMIKVLDNEKAEGIITDNSYKKVKKGLEKRLSEIEKKMK